MNLAQAYNQAREIQVLNISCSLLGILAGGEDVPEPLPHLLYHGLLMIYNLG